jgi:hypothetical protein
LPPRQGKGGRGGRVSNSGAAPGRKRQRAGATVKISRGCGEGEGGPEEGGDDKAEGSSGPLARLFPAISPLMFASRGAGFFSKRQRSCLFRRTKTVRPVPLLPVG